MYKARAWQQMLEDNDVGQKVSLYTSTFSREAFLEGICLHNDGRSYGLIIQNDGEIMWCSHDGFQPEQELGVLKVVKEEIVHRETRAERLLEDKRASAKDRLDS